MDKHTIIRLKLEGDSNREVAKMLGINRKTVAKYWNDYKELQKNLDEGKVDARIVLEKIAQEPKYDSSNRKKVKYTKELDEYLDKILDGEKEKDLKLKNHKQSLSVVQIHKLILDKGFEISYPSVVVYVREKRKKIKETAVRQQYDFGDRLEYDFGEVKLYIAGKLKTLSLAVLSSPASNFRWAYLYTNQQAEVFFDSQVRFFEMIGGMYKEVVYDNMKNVVTRFIGRNEKKLNKNLLAFANYYGFNINVTNCFKGNEKGHVEGSVRIVRKNAFSIKYEFDSFEQACEHLEKELLKMNESSLIEDEKKKLLSLRPKYDLAKITEQKVDAYSFVTVNNNKYSVPDYLVGETVLVRSYAREIKIYVNDNLVCTHKKKDGSSEYSIDIKHYLNTLDRKPGAIRNSLALKSTPYLKTIFDKYFIKEPRKFVEIIKDNKEKSTDELIDVFNEYIKYGENGVPKDVIKQVNSIELKTRMIISSYDNLLVGGNKWVLKKLQMN